MKKLILIRHAKSSWANSYLSDKDRPLNERGWHDAPLMAKLLSGECASPDLIVCSSSKRTRQTVKFFSEDWGISDSRVQYSDSLFHASVNQLLFVIKSLDEELDSVALVGHNPGLTYLVQDLINSRAPDNIPTCGIAILQSESEFWSNFEAGNPGLIKYFYPKGHLDVYK